MLALILTGFPRFLVWAEGSFLSKGLYFGLKTIFIPPLPKIIFSPSKHVFWLLLCPFCLNSYLFCIYFTLLLSIFFTLSSLSFQFLNLSRTFSIVFSSHFHTYFFLQMTSAKIPLPQGGGYFPKYRPCFLDGHSPGWNAFHYWGSYICIKICEFRPARRDKRWITCCDTGYGIMRRIFPLAELGPYEKMWRSALSVWDAE